MMTEKYSNATLICYMPKILKKSMHDAASEALKTGSAFEMIAVSPATWLDISLKFEKKPERISPADNFA